MTRFRALVAANVLLAVFALALISTDWRKDKDTRTVEFPSRLGTLSPAELEALRAQVLTTDERVVILAPTTTSASPAPVKPVTRPKPTIAGPDLMTGKHVSLSQFRGKPVFVSVWNSQNVGSLEQASTIGRWARSHEDQVAYLGIDSGDSQRDGRAFARRYQMTFPSIWDPVEKFYAWGYVPTTLVFDRGHKLMLKIYGGATPAQLDAALRRATRR